MFKGMVYLDLVITFVKDRCPRICKKQQSGIVISRGNPGHNNWNLVIYDKNHDVKYNMLRKKCSVLKVKDKKLGWY